MILHYKQSIAFLLISKTISRFNIFFSLPTSRGMKKKIICFHRFLLNFYKKISVKILKLVFKLEQSIEKSIQDLIKCLL